MENIIALFKSIEAAKVIAPEIDYSEFFIDKFKGTYSE